MTRFRSVASTSEFKLVVTVILTKKFNKCAATVSTTFTDCYLIASRQSQRVTLTDVRPCPTHCLHQTSTQNGPFFENPLLTSYNYTVSDSKNLLINTIDVLSNSASKVRLVCTFKWSHFRGSPKVSSLTCAVALSARAVLNSE